MLYLLFPQRLNSPRDGGPCNISSKIPKKTRKAWQYTHERLKNNTLHSRIQRFNSWNNPSSQLSTHQEVRKTAYYTTLEKKDWVVSFACNDKTHRVDSRYSRSNFHFLSGHFLYNFSPDNSNFRLTRTFFYFPWRFELSGIDCKLDHVTFRTWLVCLLDITYTKALKKLNSFQLTISQHAFQHEMHVLLEELSEGVQHTYTAEYCARLNSMQGHCCKLIFNRLLDISRNFLIILKLRCSRTQDDQITFTQYSVT